MQTPTNQDINNDSVLYIAQMFVKGIDAARKHFSYTDVVKVSIGGDCPIPAYEPQSRLIFLSFPFLRNYAGPKYSLSQLQTMSIDIGDSDFQDRALFNEWLTAAGIEELIHHLQNIGHPELKDRVPLEKGFSNLSNVQRALTAHEVEARKLVDIILPTVDIQSMWTDLDNHLKRTYPEQYGEPYVRK